MRRAKKTTAPFQMESSSLFPLARTLSRGVKIGAGLPELVRKQLKACLKENADLFAWSAAEMPGLDPE
ncbi:hypothetical protein A2U01_0084215, partial [Trifolium medium]|nr:hypothetical protein [Trifolium medium]